MVTEKLINLLAKENYSTIVFHILIPNINTVDQLLTQFSQIQLIALYCFIREEIHPNRQYNSMLQIGQKIEDMLINSDISPEMDLINVIHLFQLNYWPRIYNNKIFAAAISLVKNTNDWILLEREFIVPFQPLVNHYDYDVLVLLKQKKQEIS